MKLSELEPFVTTLGAYGFVFVLGAVWGSFANVCIYRWPPRDDCPRGYSVVRPSSHCVACGEPIRWYDNLPLVSYFWLRGRCRACKGEFSPRYLLVEFMTGILFVASWWFTVSARAGIEPLDLRLVRFVIDGAFCFVMVVIAFIDLDHKLILDKVTYPAIPLFYTASLFAPEREWWEGLVGAAIGYIVVWLVREAYFAFRKREGIGLGDGKLLAIIGALLGWRGVVVALFFGSVLGAVVGIIAAAIPALLRKPASITGNKAEVDGNRANTLAVLRNRELPFGPFLATAGILYLFAEPWLVVRFRLLGG